jgi:flavin reductase ActVB
MSDYADLELDPRAFLVRGEIEADDAFRPAPVDAEAFKAAMRVLAGGVVMVTARVGERHWGLTISSCCSISARPPKLLISLAHTASCLPAIVDTGRFGVSILRADQRHLAELGAVPGGRKEVDAFQESDRGLRSTPIAGALAHLDCAVDRTFDIADHTLIVGDVEEVVAGQLPEGAHGPLLYFDRTFHTLGDPL